MRLPFTSDRACAPNLLERIYLRMASTGLPGEMYLHLALADAPDIPKLREALFRTLEELPRLRSTVRFRPWGIERHLLRCDPALASSRVAVDDDEEAFLGRRPDLTTEPPIRALVAGNRLLVAVHHSASDGQGLLYVVERWAAHYGAIVAGEPPPARSGAVPSPRFRDLYGTFAPDVRRRILRRLAAPLFGGEHRRTEEFATFADRPPPGDGPLRTLVVPLSPSRTGRLMRWALARRSTVGDAVLAATLVAGYDTWPEQRRFPAFVGVPVSTRRGAPCDEAFRTLSWQFEVPSTACGSLEDALAVVRDEMVNARDVGRTAVQFAGRSLYALVPPPAFRGWADGLRSNTRNSRETLTFSNVGGLGRTLAAFGPHAIEDIANNGSLLHPPGLRVGLVGAPRSLNVCVGYLEGPVLPESAQRFAAKLDALLEDAVRAPAARAVP